jgi:hypothetical protein
MRNVFFLALAAFFYVVSAQANADAAQCRVTTTDTKVKEPGKSATDIWDGEFFWSNDSDCKYLRDGAYWCGTPSGAFVLQGYPEKKVHYTAGASSVDCFEGNARYGG